MRGPGARAPLKPVVPARGHGTSKYSCSPPIPLIRRVFPPLRLPLLPPPDAPLPASAVTTMVGRQSSLQRPF